MIGFPLVTDGRAKTSHCGVIACYVITVCPRYVVCGVVDSVTVTSLTSGAVKAVGSSWCYRGNQCHHCRLVHFEC